MESSEAFRAAVRRIAVVVILYALLFAIQEVAHGRLDLIWSQSVQLSTLGVYLVWPLFGLVLLTTSFRRGGGILLMGSLPAGLVFLVVTRFFRTHQPFPPPEDPGSWRGVYEVSYMLLIALSVLGSYFAFRIVRLMQPPAGGAPTPPDAD